MFMTSTSGFSLSSWPWSGRRVAADISRCGVNRDLFACAAGGESPQPSCAVVPFETKTRVTRQWFQLNNGRVLPAAGARVTRQCRGQDQKRVLPAARRADGQCPLPSRVVASLVIQSRAPRTVSLTKNPGRVLPPARAASSRPGRWLFIYNFFIGASHREIKMHIYANQ